MKYALLTSVVLTGISSACLAETFCGEINSYQGNLNTCVASQGKACPDFFAIGTLYTITVPVLRHGRAIYNIKSEDAAISTKITNLVGKDACVEGELDLDYNSVNVTSISADEE